MGGTVLNGSVSVHFKACFQIGLQKSLIYWLCSMTRCFFFVYWQHCVTAQPNLAVFFPSILSSIYWDKHTTLHGSVTDLLLTDDPCWQCQSRKHSTILHSITDENSLIKPSLFFIMNKFRQLPCVQIWNPCQWVQRALLRMLSVPMHQSITPNPLDTSFAPSFFLCTVTLHFFKHHSTLIRWNSH